MAKKSIVAREKKRLKLVEKFRAVRNNLKEVIAKRWGSDTSAVSDEEVWEAQIKLQQLPPNSSRVRRTHRCRSCGRPRAVYKKFGLCRICLRNAVMRGDVPGVTKASW